MFKKSILFLLVAMSIMLASCATEEPGEEPSPTLVWDGNLEVGAESKPETDEEGIITIKTPAQFVWFAHSVNGTLDQAGVYQASFEDLSWEDRKKNLGREDYEGKIVKLEMEADGIDLQDNEWPMIGRAEAVSGDGELGISTPFKGTFDGNGKIIKNLKISNPVGKAIGLFGRAEAGALIKNVKLAENVNVSGTGHVAGILGEGLGTPYSGPVNTKKLVRLANVSLEGTGEIKALQNSSRASGVAAFIVFGEVVFAYNSGITINSADGVYTAGVVACVHGGVVKYAYNSANIKNTFNGGSGTGGVTAHSRPHTSSTKDAQFTGGDIQTTFNVFNKGTIDIDIAANRAYGGVIADHSMGNITGSFNAGTIGPNGKGDDNINSGPRIGQIIGVAKTFNSTAADIKIGVNYYLKDIGVKDAYGNISAGITPPENAEELTLVSPLAKYLNENADSITGPFATTGSSIWTDTGTLTDVVFNSTVVRKMTDRLYLAAK